VSKKKITPEDYRNCRRLFHNQRLYSALFLKIKDKSGKLVNFVWNRTQRHVYATMLWAYHLGLQPHFLILKARQQGITTFCQSLGFHSTATRPGIEALVLAHDRETSQAVFEKSQTFWKYLPPDFRPARRTKNKKELDFCDLESKFSIGTAGGGETGGVARTLNFVHATEAGLWPKGGYNTLSALRECLPIESGFLSLESTAYEPTGVFFDKWDLCKDNLNVIKKWVRNGRRGAPDMRGSFIPIFIPWFLHEEYRIPLLPGEEINLTEEEEALTQEHNLSLEQIKFRRHKDRTCGDDRPKWYPENPEECWKYQSGRILPEFDKKTHVVKSFPVNDRDKWMIVGGIDFGADHPFTYERVAINKKTFEIYVFSEFGRRNLIAADQIREIKNGRVDGTYPNIIFADPSSRAGRLELQAGNVRTYKAANDINWSIQLLKTLLRPHPITGKPMLHVMESCKHTIRQLESWSRKLKAPGVFGEIHKVNDDFVDALRYAVYSVWLLWRRKKIKTPWDWGVNEAEGKIITKENTQGG